MLLGKCFECRSGFLTRAIRSQQADTRRSSHKKPPPPDRLASNEPRESMKKSRTPLLNLQLDRAPSKGFALGDARRDLPSQKHKRDVAAVKALTREILSLDFAIGDECDTGVWKPLPNLPRTTTDTIKTQSSPSTAPAPSPKAQEPEAPRVVKAINNRGRQLSVDDRVHRLKTKRRDEHLRISAEDKQRTQTLTTSEIKRKTLGEDAANRISEGDERREEAKRAWNKRQTAGNQQRPLGHAESKELFLPTATASDAEKRRKAAEVWSKVETAVDEERRRKAAEAWDNLLKGQQLLVHSASKELFLPPAAPTTVPTEAELERRREAHEAWKNAETARAKHRPVVHTASKELFLTVPAVTTTPSFPKTTGTSELSRFSMEFDTAASKTVTAQAETAKLDTNELEVNLHRGGARKGQMSGRISTVGLWNSYSSHAETESKLQGIVKLPEGTERSHALPDMKRVSKMTFDGTCLEGAVDLSA